MYPKYPTIASDFLNFPINTFFIVQNEIRGRHYLNHGISNDIAHTYWSLQIQIIGLDNGPTFFFFFVLFPGAASEAKTPTTL